MQLELMAPLQRGYRRMVNMLFKPFDISRWFMLGFTAWLSTLGEGGFSSSVGDLGNLGDSADMEGVGNVFREHMVMVVAIVFAIVVISVVIGLVLLWVRSRGKFMFLYNVALNRTEVKRPWRDWADQGNSLFWWTFVFGLVYFLGMMVAIGIGAGIALPSIQAQTFGPSAVVGIAIGSLLMIAAMILFGFVATFLEDFIIPIMYLDASRATEAWHRFMPVFKAQAGTFILYGLFRFGLSILLAIVIMALVIITCCCAGILLAIPYLNAVLLLPLTVWWRTFSLEYLRQLGPEFDVWNRPPPEPEAGTPAPPSPPEDTPPPEPMPTSLPVDTHLSQQAEAPPNGDFT